MCSFISGRHKDRSDRFTVHRRHIADNGIGEDSSAPESGIGTSVQSIADSGIHHNELGTGKGCFEFLLQLSKQHSKVLCPL